MQDECMVYQYAASYSSTQTTTILPMPLLDFRSFKWKTLLTMELIYRETKTGHWPTNTEPYHRELLNTIYHKNTTLHSTYHQQQHQQESYYIPWSERWHFWIPPPISRQTHWRDMRPHKLIPGVTHIHIVYHLISTPMELSPGIFAATLKVPSQLVIN